MVMGHDIKFARQQRPSVGCGQALICLLLRASVEMINHNKEES